MVIFNSILHWLQTHWTVVWMSKTTRVENRVWHVELQRSLDIKYKMMKYEKLITINSSGFHSCLDGQWIGEQVLPTTVHCRLRICQLTDAAQYSCRAYNTLGSAVRTYNLTIHGNILKSVIWYHASIRQSIRVSDRRSILMRLYSPVDLTGNINMIEKLVFGGTGTRDLPIISLMH